MTLIEQLLKIFEDKLNQVGRIKEIDLLTLKNEFDLLEQIAGPIIMQELNQTYRKQLKSLFNLGLIKTESDNFGGLTQDQFEFIQKIDGEQILRSFSTFTNDYSNQIIKGLFNGEDYNKLKDRIGKEIYKTDENGNKIPTPPGWIIAQIDSVQDQSQAVMTQKVFEDAPNQKFNLAGPIDDKTRCQCKAVMLNQPKQGFTIEQIKKGAWTKIALNKCPKFATDKATNGQYTWTFRGGFNCRHYAEPAE